MAVSYDLKTPEASRALFTPAIVALRSAVLYFT